MSLGQKGIVHIISLLVVALIAGAAIWFFLNKGGLGIKGTTMPISPSQLMPLVSAQEARTTICNLKKKELFAQACQSKFNVVGKEDVEKIAELFSLISEVQNDKNISDYERLLMGQLLFVSLPTKDSPLNSDAMSLSLPEKIKNFLGDKRNIVYAQELNSSSGMSEEEFKKRMAGDLQKIVGELTKGDNAWVINVMISRYQWIDRQRQPIYSDQYSESFDPYPGVSNEPKDESKILYHVRSVVGSRLTRQAIAGGSFQGTGEMIAYSFSIMSWNSSPYGEGSVLTVAESGPEAKYLTSRLNLSEEDYQGENLLSDLLVQVKMPLRQQPKTEKQKSSDDKFPKFYTREEWVNLADDPDLENKCPAATVKDFVVCHRTVEEADKAYEEKYGSETPGDSETP